LQIVGVTPRYFDEMKLIAEVTICTFFVFICK
jgi:hypothetical protein